jgi:CheY-like chemotaxis protein
MDQNKTILLIDDDYLDIEAVKRSLKKLGGKFTLQVAHNGVDALGMLTDEFKRVVPDVILLDLNMPKMNGMEILAIIKSYYSLKSIKVFILSTSAEDYEIRAAQNYGVSGYILKPLDFSKDPSPDTVLLKKTLLGID